MKRCFSKLAYGMFLLAFVQGQFAFGLPETRGPIGPVCGRHLDVISPDAHHHHASDNGGIRCDHGQCAGHRAGGEQGQCDHECKGDGCCSGCNACGHCPTAIVAALQLFISSAGYQPCSVSLPLQDPPPSPIFQPPRSLPS
jgi:hypothetical protein